MIYHLTFINNFDRLGIFCVYLRPAGPDGAGPPNETDGTDDRTAPYSLAWQTARVPLGGQAEFTWKADYAFAWAETGPLAPGVVFEARQILPADPATPRKSAIALDYRYGAFTFAPTAPCPSAGDLCIFCETAVPTGLAAVGLCLAGKPALAWNSRFNHRFIFRPDYRYWAAFGDFTPGETLDPARLTGARELRFPAAGGAISLRLEQSGQWTEL